MAAKRSETPTAPAELTPEPPQGPSEPRRRFLAGEITWNDYIAAENAAQSPKP